MPAPDEGNNIAESSDETTEDTESSEDINNADDTEVEGEDTDQPEEEGTPEENTEGKPDETAQDGKTPKGTKADRDPLSLANQLRANAEAKAKQYEQFLEDPDRLEQYLADLRKERGIESPAPVKPDGKQEPEIRLEEVKDVMTLQKYLTQERQELDALKKEWSQTRKKDEAEKTVETISGRIRSVQQKYPALRAVNADGSPNPEFDKDLEDTLGQLYQELDFDPKTKSLRGQVDLVKLADRFMKAVERGQALGSKKAQTITVEKRTGKPPGGPAQDTTGGIQGMSAEQKVAARIQKVYSRRSR